MKKIILFIFFGFLLLSSPKVSATEPENAYDSASEKVMIYTYMDSIDEVTIEINSESYIIKKSVTGKWSYSYYVTILNNKITNANRLVLNIYSGSSNSQSLNYNSTAAICSFNYKYGLITSIAKVQAKIRNNKLIVV